MAKIIVENFKDTDDTQDHILTVRGYNCYSASNAAASLKRILAAYKAMWPDDPVLNRLHIVELDK